HVYYFISSREPGRIVEIVETHCTRVKFGIAPISHKRAVGCHFLSKSSDQPRASDNDCFCDDAFRWLARLYTKGEQDALVLTRISEQDGVDVCQGCPTQ